AAASGHGGTPTGDQRDRARCAARTEVPDQKLSEHGIRDGCSPRGTRHEYLRQRAPVVAGGGGTSLRVWLRAWALRAGDVASDSRRTDRRDRAPRDDEVCPAESG